MKKIPFVLGAALAALMAAPTAMAGSGDIDLTMTGIIRTGACVPVLAGGGIAEYGEIGAIALDPDTYTSLGRKSVNLTVTCPAAAQWGLRAVDRRAATVTDPATHRFGLGVSSDDENIGYYGVNIRNVVVGGTGGTGGTAGINLVTRDRQRWDERDFFYADSALIHTFAAPGATAPTANLGGTAELSVDTFINPGSALSLNRDVSLDGLVTLELVYY